MDIYLAGFTTGGLDGNQSAGQEDLYVMKLLPTVR